jgi:hypothetical protein
MEAAPQGKIRLMAQSPPGLARRIAPNRSRWVVPRIRRPVESEVVVLGSQVKILRKAQVQVRPNLFGVSPEDEIHPSLENGISTAEDSVEYAVPIVVRMPVTRTGHQLDPQTWDEGAGKIPTQRQYVAICPNRLLAAVTELPGDEAFVPPAPAFSVDAESQACDFKPQRSVSWSGIDRLSRFKTQKISGRTGKCFSL